MNGPDPAIDGMPRLVIDRNSPIPLYFQVAQHLESAISSGELPIGSLLQNEVDLAQSLGLSRPTMRRAMQHLVDKGLVTRRRGIGTRVVRPKLRRPLELTSLYDDLDRAGKKPTTEVLSFEMVDAEEDVAAGLDLPGGDPRPRARPTPTGWRRADRQADELPPRGGGPFRRRRPGCARALRPDPPAGISLHSATQTLGARTATAAEARMLDESRGAALITAIRITYDDSGKAVEYGTHIYASSRYTFEINLLTT